MGMILKITTDSDKIQMSLVDGIVVNMDACVKAVCFQNRIKTEESLKSISDKYFFSVYLILIFIQYPKKISRNDERLKI